MLLRVPASSANLGPGFDTLGMALTLHLELTDEPGVLPGAPVDHGHPSAKAFARAGGTGPVWVRSPIPSGRGLGFSGAARVAGAMAGVLRREQTEPLSDGSLPEDLEAEVLAITTALEGHPDNVAASLCGGVVAAAAGRALRLPLELDPVVVVWVPGFQTSTDASRAGLPDQVSRADAVFNVGRTALLIVALGTGDIGALRDATDDRLHQDARFRAAPPSRAALDAALSAGAWCGWLSGSGPTIAALCGPDQADVVAAALPPGASVKVLRIATDGARAV